jgi:hypothetical protein
VREGLDEARAHRDVGVKEVGEGDPLRLRRELERRPVAVEGPGLALLDDREARLVVAVDEALGDLAVRRPVREGEDLGPVEVTSTTVTAGSATTPVTMAPLVNSSRRAISDLPGC